MVKVNIILPLAVGDNVAHEKYGRGVITGYMVEEIARSSDDVLRTTYTVNFNEAIRGCLSHKLEAAAPEQADTIQM